MFTNPASLPTDNLYKFIALSGVVLAIAGWYLPYQKSVELVEEAAHLKADMQELLVEMKFNVQNLKIYSRPLIQAADTTKRIDKSLINQLTQDIDELDFRRKAEADSLDLPGKITINTRMGQLAIALLETMNEKGVLTTANPEQSIEGLRTVVENLREMAIRSSKLQARAELGRVKLRAAKQFVIAGWIGISLGALLASAGFWFWFTKVQRHIDKKISDNNTAK